MIDGRFNIVFSGRTLPNIPLPEVKAKVARLFKTDPAQVESLFSGQTVAIKKNVDYATAKKYQSAMKQAGALVLIEKVEQQSSIQQSQSGGDKVSATVQPASQVQKRAEESVQSIEDISMNEVGLAKVGTVIPSVAQSVEAVNPDISGYSMSAEGSLLQDEKRFTPREVDTSALSLSGVGERLLPQQDKDVPDAPDTSHLQLKD